MGERSRRVHARTYKGKRGRVRAWAEALAPEGREAGLDGLQGAEEARFELVAGLGVGGAFHGPVEIQADGQSVQGTDLCAWGAFRVPRIPLPGQCYRHLARNPGEDEREDPAQSPVHPESVRPEGKRTRKGDGSVDPLLQPETV